MPSARQLQLVLVTPETTVLDEPVESLRFPLYDGQIGVLPGRAPVVGRLGYGELKLTASGVERSYYIDGGFVQVKGNVVSVLTNRSLTSDEIDVTSVEEQLREASSRVPTSDLEFAEKDRDQQRARSLLAMAK